MYKLELSPYHEIFYHEWKLNPNNSGYNLVFDQTLSTNLDIEHLKSSLYRFVLDYTILGSHVLVDNQKLYWIKNASVKGLDFFSNNSDANLVLKYAITPFDLEQGPLYRFGVFLNNDNTYRLVLVFHHILIDGSSFNELITTISYYYNDLGYKFTTSNQQQIEQIKNTTQQLFNKIASISANSNKFWSRELMGVEAVDLRFTEPSTVIKHNSSMLLPEINELCFHLDANTMDRLYEMTTIYGISKYFYGQLIFAILLYRYTSQERFAISYPSAISEHIGLIYGAGVNTNCFPYTFDNTITNLQLIIQVKQKIDQIKHNRYYPIGQIIAQSPPQLLNVMFAQTNLKRTKFSFNDVDVLKINSEYDVDLASGLTMEQEEYSNTIHYRIRYYKTKIDKIILKKFISAYKRLFKNILVDLLNKTEKKISEYSILSPEDYHKIVYRWNNTQKYYPKDKTIPELFEEQVRITPNNIAVVYENKQLTYQELNIYSNQLASYLIKTCKLTKEDLIALVQECNEYTIITILAILKLGCAYVPIDPQYPDERIRYIIEDTQTKLILVSEIYQSKIIQICQSIKKETNVTQVLAIDNPNLHKYLSQENTTSPSITIESDNLAYVIYTSGTTGKPKGVMIEHSNVISLVKNVEYIKIRSVDSFILLSDISFDAATFEIWAPLLNRAKLVVVPNRKDLFCNINLLHKILIKNNISVLWLTKTLFDQIFLLNKAIFKSLKYLLIGGEPLNKELIYKLVNSKDSPNNVINGYGPTENTTFSCTFSMNKNNTKYKSSIPLGKPLINRTAYVLNSNLQPVPIGVIGELYLSGAGVARGYLNQIQLTKEKFLDNPFKMEEKSFNKYRRLYKTGDLVKYLPDSNIIYIGRKDSQVKINGYRIELGEIETKLLEYPNVTQSVVLAYNNEKNNSRYLVGYYVSKIRLNEKEILKYLSEQLPYYMVPCMLKHLDYLPLTINGKLDKMALLNFNIVDNANAYVAPRNNIESIICSLYTELLQLAPNLIGINSDFFKSGGTSLLAIRLAAKLQNYFTISVNDIFKLRTPEQIALAATDFVKDNLQKQMHQVNLMYSKLRICRQHDKAKMKQKQSEYLSNIGTIKFEYKIKPINTVLLTGASGYLGSNILYQLLSSTQYKVYLLVRAESDKEAYTKLEHKFKFYFNDDLANYQHRIKVIPSDIEFPDLKLPTSVYQELVLCIDSIIHCAALAKHYGGYNVFYSVNVQATINLLELAKLTRLKDFHYISTVSVFINGYIPNCSYYVYNETDTNELLQNQENVYSRTKYEGEIATIKYRKFGVKSNIYRVGNLSMHSQSYKIQENFEENAFFVRVKTMLTLGLVPMDLAEVEISPVDCTALAIVKLFNQAGLSNQTYHVFNPNKSNLITLLSNNSVCVRIIHLSEFIDIISMYMSNNGCDQHIELFMLHQLWLKQIDLDKLTKIDVVQDKTSHILDKLGFTWPSITGEMLTDFISKANIKD